MFAAAVLLAACERDTRAEDDTLVVYSAGPRGLADEVVAAFERETGVNVEFFGATTGQVMARLEAERYRPRADVGIFASRAAAEHLKGQARLLRYPEPDWLDATHTEWHDPDHYYFATSGAIVGIALRGDVADQTPEWTQLFGGDFPGQVTMPSPSRSGSAGDFTVAYLLEHGDEAWDNFLQARQQGMDFAAANSQAISGLLVGTYDAIAGAVDYLIYAQIADGADLHMHYPVSGSAFVERPIAILADTPVPETARKFVDFYIEQQRQEMVADYHLLPVRRDVDVSDVRGDADIPPVFATDIEETVAAQNRLLRRFQLEIERAEVLPAAAE